MTIANRKRTPIYIVQRAAIAERTSHDLYSTRAAITDRKDELRSLDSIVVAL
jgi:hypothetical protein